MRQDDRAIAEPTAADAARSIIRSALKASLATLEIHSGFPYASLVTVAFHADGAPLLLLSRFAVHTRNLMADHRASLLFDASDGGGDPLAGGRVTVIGRLEPITLGESAGGEIAGARARFLARHPGAAMYVDFSDFGFWHLTIERAHYIGGFGRIVDLSASDLLIDISGAQQLLAAEADIIAHMNSNHAHAIELYATRLAAGEPSGEARPWRMSGLDPAGFDLIDGQRAVRIGFATPVTNPDAARAEFVRMAKVVHTDQS